MHDAVLEALRAARPSLDAPRVVAERGRQALSTPQALGPWLWLAAQPIGLAMAASIGRGHTLSTQIGLWRHPLITSIPQAAAARALPPLVPLAPAPLGARGLVFDLGLEVSVNDLAAAVRRQLTGQSMTAGGFRLLIGDLAVSTADERLALQARLEGDTTGLLKVRSRPAFDPTSGGSGSRPSISRSIRLIKRPRSCWPCSTAGFGINCAAWPKRH